MKKFVAKGLVKIERQTTKSMQYHLTPQGMTAVAEKTLNYMRNSYIAVRDMTNKIIELGTYYLEKGYDIHIEGVKDEMMELCTLALNDGKIPYSVGIPEDIEKSVIFCWEDETAEKLKNYNIVNLLR